MEFWTLSDGLAGLHISGQGLDQFEPEQQPQQEQEQPKPVPSMTRDEVFSELFASKDSQGQHICVEAASMGPVGREFWEGEARRRLEDLRRFQRWWRKRDG